MTDCIQQSFTFQGLGKRRVEADFRGGNLSADGGVMLLREADQAVGLIEQLAECFRDHRKQCHVEHSVTELLSQRIFGLAMGYEDLNDHDSLRHDPVMAAGVGKTDPLGLERFNPRDSGKALAGKSTLNRLELTNAKNAAQPNNSNRGPFKIEADFDAIQSLLITFAVSQLAEDTTEIVLDFDATDSLIHGNQEGKFYHGYYDAYCYLPLYCFIGDWPLWAQQRTSNRDASAGTVEALEKILPKIRARFPEARVILRGDSGFARDDILDWCEKHGIFYVVGLAKNAVLLRHLEPTLFRATADACVRGGHCTYFCEFDYRTKKSWSRTRRVIGKAQVNPKGRNPRFIVTNLPGDSCGDETGDEARSDPRWRPKPMYCGFYCARGDMENRIKEQQLDLFSDRMSSASMQTNQLRMWFSTFAYVLMVAFRDRGLSWSEEYRRAAPATIRDRLLKIATQIKISVRRVVLHWSSSFRYQAEVAECCRRLRTAPG